MEERENTGFIIRNYYHDGCPFDFTTKRHTIEESIERHKAKLQLTEKYGIESDSNDVLPSLIFDLRIIKDILKGKFDILVIFERDAEKADEKFPYLDALFDGGC